MLLQRSAATTGKEGVCALLACDNKKRLNVSRIPPKRGTSDLAGPLDADPDEVTNRESIYNVQSEYVK